MATTSQGSDFDRAKRWGKKFLADWKEGSRSNGEPAGAGAKRRGAHSAQGDVGEMLARWDCWPDLVRGNGPGNGQLHRLVIGRRAATGSA